LLALIRALTFGKKYSRKQIIVVKGHLVPHFINMGYI
jgi:hypothetical protein